MDGDLLNEQTLSENNMLQKEDNAIATTEIPSDFSTSFASAVDDAKLKVLEDAQKTDTKFVEDFKSKLKEATLKLAEVEKNKAEVYDAYVQLKQKNVEYEKELVQTKQKLNEYQQIEDKWNNKQRAREFHYNGVKDVMLCIGIKNPMCIVLLYLLFPIALIFFIIKSVVTATFGNLLCGAIDGNRPKAMQGFFWTILALFTLAVLAFVVWFVVTRFVL